MTRQKIMGHIHRFQCAESGGYRELQIEDGGVWCLGLVLAESTSL